MSIFAFINILSPFYHDGVMIIMLIKYYGGSV